MTLPLSEASTDEVATTIRRFKSPENRFKVNGCSWGSSMRPPASESMKGRRCILLPVNIFGGMHKNCSVKPQVCDVLLSSRLCSQGCDRG